MNEQDRLAKVAAVRPNIDERDVDAVRRKTPEHGFGPDFTVPHQCSCFVNGRLGSRFCSILLVARPAPSKRRS